ncbi:unnamed protein product [Rotaria sordida]|uniref:SET domain-containing protein n=1 Tax=Rotaria sordida TaxID=392033 RepID=A0A815K587_9BILA|nr:unnamed protein product [Rotaria sordida]CAF1385307.1 unnamed protein product [Rotaria sordida]CAF1522634.1 unnamed protein product [Rotaria sordida]CAF4021286.1 unnamed protein product [Rotaria sordida]
MTTAKVYRNSSWIDKRIEVRESPIHGKGLFAREPLAVGEIIIVCGGQLWPRTTPLETLLNQVHRDSIVPLDDEYYLCMNINDPPTNDIYMNHSCNPNTWLQDECTVVVRSPINRNDEITTDYAMISDDDIVITESCQCKSDQCRRLITLKDWMRPELQERYFGHFLPFLNNKIKLLQESQKSISK